MAGMTSKQIEAAERPLIRKMLDKTMTDKERIEYESLCCRSMANSCIIYGEEYNWNNRYKQQYIDKLGEAKTDQIFAEQKELLSRAIIQKNAHTDSEGVSYNSVIWPDEQEQDLGDER